MKKLLLFVIFALSLVQLSQAQPAPASTPVSAKTSAAGSGIVLPPEKASPVRLPRVDKAPVIDGRLDDEVWKQAAVFKDFYQVRPGDNIEPSKPSEAYIAYDSKFLYLAFRAYDEPGKVRATVAKRDGIFEDDFIGVYLDTFNDKRKAIELFFNPLGIQADAIRTEGSGEDFSIDFVHESKGVVDERGYTVEVAVPFKSLRYEAGKDKLWGLHIFRSIKRFNNELDSWMPLSREISGTLIQQGYVTGIEGLSTERPLEIIPSITLSETGKRARSFQPVPLNGVAAAADPGRLLNKPIEADLGVTAKWGITPTVTLDLALNPDFAQVEADATVVTANQRFPIFFEEKRPFFLEGKDIFLTPLTAVHTRAIVDPDVAVKLTGKTGRNTFGILLASDNAPGNFSEEEREDPVRRAAINRFLDANAQIGILRLKRDFGRENTLGLIGTTYNFIGRHNHLGGFDGRFKLDPKTVFSFQVLGTHTSTEPVPDTHFNRNGFGYRWNFDRAWRNSGININGDGFTRFYRADVGFTSRTNTNAVRINPRWNTEPKPKAKIVSWRANATLQQLFDWQGRSQRWDVQPMFGVNMQRQTFLTFGYRRAYERLFAEEFGGRFIGTDPERSTYKHSIIAVVESTPSKQLFFFAQVVRDFNVFDFDFGAGPRFPRVSPAALINSNAPLDPGAGDLWNIQGSVTYRPSDALRTSFDFNKQRLVRDDTGRVAFDENIFTSRTTYQFTRFLFARGRIDYSTLASRLRGQFLLGWTPNPGTAFYAGYNDDLNRNGFNPFTGQLEPGFRRNGRTFFVKMSYLIRRSL
ncbi:MAG TPA: DUF5916 domain-containing protein [Pyrinomonadaceae bacterium]|nr:DUF5916 domain-containing protein [Pyrinomonadaceae bacterium]